MDVVIHAAVAENGVIGADGGLPWRLSSDLKRFKAGTMGRPVIMGRKTFEGIGKPLPGRLNIVVTRDRSWAHEGVETAGSLDEAIRLATVRARCMTGVDEIAVIGGGEIYAQAMPLADRLHITHVLAEPAGDTRFPAIDAALWTAKACEDVPAGERDSHATRYCVYERKPG
ncbi:dihydrofolate reductase [Mesorhizobium sp. J428]|uniref:dihydrofolate reductase n=1 Tax=Mesorhizobium sp. J428 TaxID=2898440 RepID=UPI0021514E26|nr:dihydrofolate reductase [Mesorhizobium sp. J428]MCR5859442.1 dihydrofolate reductase [Mesorhizobium sp. J428]